MKKLALALVCLVSVAFFASCTETIENPEPSIAVVAADGFVQDGDVIDLQGDTTLVTFGFNVASNPDTKKMLSTLKVTVDDVVWAEVNLAEKSEFTYSDVIAYTFNREIVGNSTIIAIVTDEAGKSNTASINLSFNQVAQPLEAKDFTWFRHGGNDATGLAEYGLEWTGNGKEVFAIIKPVAGATLFMLTPEDWNAITTDVEKADFFAEGSLHVSIPDFRGVSAWNTKDYDYVLATLYNGEYNLIHITKGVVDNNGSAGTDITITGQSK